MAEQPPKTAPIRLIAEPPPTQQPKTPPKAAPMRIRTPPPPEPVRCLAPVQRPKILIMTAGSGQSSGRRLAGRHNA